jgi:Cu+-exporting ATPase
MALEPVDARTEDDDSELIDMRRRFVASAALTLPVLVIAMGDMVLPGSPVHDALGDAARWIEFAFATPVVLWGAWPLLVRAWRSVATWQLNMFTLIGLGTSVAYVYSVFAVTAPGLFPDGFRGEHGVAVYFEAAAVIVTLVLLGQVLELRARKNTGSAIRALLDLSPKMARRVGENGDEEDVPLDDVQTGDRLRVRPGEAVPVDGPYKPNHYRY